MWDHAESDDESVFVLEVGGEKGQKESAIPFVPVWMLLFLKHGRSIHHVTIA